MTQKEKNTYTFALVGNPNSGKSSIFNKLTGLRQSVGNFPGVTVDKKTGVTILGDGTRVEIIDFPGLYSLYPNSSDEKLVVNMLTDPSSLSYPDLILYVADATNLERHLLLATQIIDLKIPMIFIVNMIDIAETQEITIDKSTLEDHLQVPVILTSNHMGHSIDSIKSIMNDFIAKGAKSYVRDTMILSTEYSKLPAVEAIDAAMGNKNYYLSKVYAHHHDWLTSIDDRQRTEIRKITEKENFENLKLQVDETMARYDINSYVIRKSVQSSTLTQRTLTDKIDDILTHRIWGSVVFFALLFFIFQAIFSWSELPMTWIEDLFSWAGSTASEYLPEGWMRDLLVEGILAGLGGIMVFIPQIAILFFLISILEETGYMARVVFMYDDVMRKFGLNGRSIVALVSSSACAIPAIMSTRTIANWKERLTTILVTPLMSCNARIPVYTVLIGFAVSPGHIYGFNKQGLAFMGLYLLGLTSTLVTAIILKYTLKTEGNSMLIMEMPQYKTINWRHALLTVKEKVITFIIEAGKVILVISMILWFLASYGPSDKMKQAQESIHAMENISSYSPEEVDNMIASKKLEASYAGHIGKIIEPVIKPLGFDWKIGIALITSFAAREVFVGTMATIYSVGNTDDESSVRERMATEMRPDGTTVYDQATSWSLLVFYVFALQCLSTLAVTRRETKSWKWPVIQFLFMGGLAYLGSYIVYNLLS